MGVVVRKLAYRPWPVTVRLNTCDAAGNVTPVEHTFVGHFNAFTEADHDLICQTVDERFPKAEGSSPLPRATILKRNAAYFERLMCGWSGLQDESGQEFPFSPLNLDFVVTGPDGFAFSDALFVAIAEIRFGGAPLKNLLASAVPGEISSAAGVETTAIAAT